MKEKSNKQFMILSAIGILMVVDAHSWTVVDLLASLLPYKSFFMPMLVFVSGYFYEYEKEQSLPSFLKRKTLHLLLPYFAWETFYGLFVTALKRFTPIHYGHDFTLVTWLIVPWGTGEIFDINNPAWFVMMLFEVCVLYALVRTLLARWWNETAALFGLTALAAACVYLSQRGYSRVYVLLPILRTGFFLAFYQWGIWWHKVGSPRLRHLWKRKALLFLLPLAINAVCAVRYGDLNYNSCRMLEMENGPLWLPLLTSLTGIVFWASAAKCLEPVLGQSRLCNYISGHTFTIMMNHIAFMALLNWGLLWVNRFYPLPGLDVQSIETSAWYRYSGMGTGFYFFYFLAGLLGSLLLCRLMDRAAAFFRRLY